MANTNAKSEFLNHISFNKSKVLCAVIQISTTDPSSEKDGYQSPLYLHAELKRAYTKDDWDGFLNLIDVNYDSGYGEQELFGTIWYENGTWSERGEYDGSEWWSLNKCPDIPETLLNVAGIRDFKINQIILDRKIW